MVIGHLEAIYRYPVKSMGGERLESAALGWHGIAGDRRLALRRLDDRSDFPWLSASRLPEPVSSTPERRDDDAQGDLPTHVRTPDGNVLPPLGEGDNAPAISVTTRDLRCSMVDIDPVSASCEPEVMKAVVRVNQNNAGIYGTVIRTGRLSVGQSIFLQTVR